MRILPVALLLALSFTAAAANEIHCESAESQKLVSFNIEYGTSSPSLSLSEGQGGSRIRQAIRGVRLAGRLGNTGHYDVTTDLAVYRLAVRVGPYDNSMSVQIVSAQGEVSAIYQRTGVTNLGCWDTYDKGIRTLESTLAALARH